MYIEEDTARKYMDENEQITKADFIKLGLQTNLVGEHVKTGKNASATFWRRNFPHVFFHKQQKLKKNYDVALISATEFSCS